jgi:hypothetical protein
MRRWFFVAGVTLALAGCSGDPIIEADVSFGDSTSPPRDGITTGDGVSPTGDGGLPGDDAMSPVGDGGAPTDDIIVPPTDGGGPMDGGPIVMLPDADGDTISDADEGVETSVDTDGDGTPDYLDNDSDDDTIPDDREAGDANLGTPPRDSDRDGRPDYRDGDSDDNSWPDREEGAGDLDRDGRPDCADDDNDGDYLPDSEEVGMVAGTPADTDGDGVPDLNEIDSDGDNIKDADEGAMDTDRDRMLDRVDTDSDNDGYTDREEAGDEDLETAAVDTDMDGTPDYRDPDSDNDGLSDRLERTNMTSRTVSDTDGDGVSDLVEVGAGTRPTDRADNPRTRGNFVFVVPYMMPPDPARDTLQFSTTIQRADVYFLMDTTGSMGGEINNLKSGIAGTLIPEIRRRIPDAWMGVGRYDDYPTGSFGGGADRPLRHITDITNDDGAVRGGVNALTLGSGGDGPESGLQAIYAIITGEGLTSGNGQVGPRSGCPAGRFGYPCFRPDAVPVIINFTDAPFHNGPGGANNYSFAAPDFNTTVARLTARRAKVLTVFSCPSGSYCDQGFSHHTTMANQTGAAAGGSAFVYRVGEDGAGLSGAVVDGIEAVSRLALDVSVRASDVMEGSETVDAVASFIDHLEARTTAAPGLMCTTTYTPYDREGIDGDTFNDSFRAVRGEPVCFDIITKMNSVVRPTEAPQLFRARLNVIGDGFTPLDERVIFFLVPPSVPDPN